MSKETYSLPTGPTARFDYQRNAIERSTGNAAAWGIPQSVIDNLQVLQKDYESRYLVASNKNTRSKATTVARDEYWGILAAGLADLYDQHLISNAAITASDKTALHIHTTTGRNRQVTPAALTTPVVSAIAEEIGVLHFVFSDSAASNGSHSKPAGVAFCEIWGKIGNPAPATPAECPERLNIARSHEGVVFQTTNRNLPFYGFARWVNKNGKTGVWSAVFSATIP